MKRGRGDSEGPLRVASTAACDEVVEVTEAERREEALNRLVTQLTSERVSSARWREARRLLFSKPQLASDEIVIYVLSVLRVTASNAQIGADEWESCRKGAEQLYAGRTSLLEQMRRMDDEGEGELEIVAPPAKRARAVPVSSSTPAATSSASAAAEAVLAPAFHLLLVEGEAEGKAHTIGLSDVVHAGCDLAVVCNYMHDLEWLYGHAAALATMEKVLIVHGMDAAAERQWRAFVGRLGVGERVQFCRPHTPAFGTVHTKLWVLFYGARGVRIFLTTANNVEGDYLHKTQGGWLRDFPLAAAAQRADSGTAEPDAFRDELHRYMSHAVKGSVGDELQRKLALYDFRAADAHLVTSVPGVHRGTDVHRHGHMRLRRLLEAEDTEEDGASRAVCQFSSLGSLRDKWLEAEFATSLFASRGRRESGCPLLDTDRIQLVYPTVRQVGASVEGCLAGASLPVRPANLERPHVTSRLHRWEASGSGRARYMPHIKTFARYEAHTPRRLAWCFLGSFNLSVAAWGRLQGKAADRLNVLAYEAGVLLTPTITRPRKDAHSIAAALCAPGAELPPLVSDRRCRLVTCDEYWGDREDEDEEAGGEGGVVQLPLPYRLPPQRYARGDRAWTVDILEEVMRSVPNA